MMTPRLRSLLWGVVAWAALPLASQASLVNYFNGFGPSDDTLDFSTGGFVLNTGAGTLDYTGQNSGTAQNHFASEQLTNIITSPGAEFHMETKFDLSGDVLGSTADASIGFMALSSANNGSGAYYIADWRVTQATSGGVGRLRIVNTGGAPALASAANSTASVTAGTYVLRLSGVYLNTGAIDFTLSLYDATGTTQIGTSATATTATTPGTGQYFGLRHRTGGSGGGSPLSGWTTSANFDYLSVTAVPEASSFVLMAVAAAAGAAQRAARRRR